MKNLKKIRLSLGLKQREIAKIAGVSYQMYSHYETGRRDLPVRVAKKIAEGLKVNWMELYD